MKRIYLSLLLPLLIAGCGYTTGTLLPTHIKTVAVPTFANLTYRPGVEVDLCKRIIDRFTFDGNLRIAPSERADSLLQGEVAGYQKQALRYRDNEKIEEYRLILSVNVSFKDLRKDKVIWEAKGFSGKTEYFPAEKSEEDALTEAIDDLAKKIVDKTIEGW